MILVPYKLALFTIVNNIIVIVKTVYFFGTFTLKSDWWICLQDTDDMDDVDEEEEEEEDDDDEGEEEEEGRVSVCQGFKGGNMQVRKQA